MGDFFLNLATELVAWLLLLPFFLLWWAFKADFGLLEAPKRPEPAPTDPSTQPTAVWDRDLDGADGPA